MNRHDPAPCPILLRGPASSRHDRPTGSADGPATPTTSPIAFEATRRAIGPDTAGVVVVHIGGLVTPDIHDLKALCDEHGLFLFEDAAHAHGSSLGDRMAGTFGVAGSFSFYPTKVI